MIALANLGGLEEITRANRKTNCGGLCGGGAAASSSEARSIGDDGLKQKISP